MSDEDNKSPMEDLDDSDVAEMELETARASPTPPSSPELFCVGCDISSKSDCPVEKLIKNLAVTLSQLFFMSITIIITINMCFEIV